MPTEAASTIAMGTPAPDFALPDCNPRRITHRQLVTRDDARGELGLLVMFICNHCPYVIAIRERLVEDCRELMGMGYGVVAISANDAAAYPADGPGPMGEVTAAFGYPFAYLYDESQSVARAYGAVCTPDFFAFDRAMTLRYRGRLDAAARGPRDGAQPRELVDALRRLAETGQAPAVQNPSIGCSIKWR